MRFDYKGVKKSHKSINNNNNSFVFIKEHYTNTYDDTYFLSH